jgi:DNA-binding YbaB/EbfC family protein
MGMFDKMKDAKNMYSNIKKAQNEINKIKVEGSAGAGAVKVVAKGNHQIVSIEIDNDAHTGNKKILEDYLIAACNDAMNKLEKETKDKMGSVMNLPGGMKLPF